jgi:hypothetical protein
VKGGLKVVKEDRRQQEKKYYCAQYNSKQNRDSKSIALETFECKFLLEYILVHSSAPSCAPR